MTIALSAYTSTPSLTNKLLPVPNRTIPFWLSEPDLELQECNATTELPQEADVVIIGSGLSGAMTGYHLTKGLGDGEKPMKIVMLEAAEVCSGATARNGGHCKPMTYYSFDSDAKNYGSTSANECYTFESNHLNEYASIIASEDIDCDMHVTQAIDVFFDPSEVQVAKRGLERRRREFPDSCQGLREIDDAGELERISGIKGALWGIMFPAGHLWPYKLATGLIRKSIQRGLTLHTQTPVLSLHPSSKNDSNTHPWSLQTPKGTLHAHSVVIATNAYTAGILPEFNQKIIPVRGTACSITPSPSHSLGNLPGPLRFSYGIRFGPGESDYMISRQGRGRIPGLGDRSLILGGAKGCFLGEKEEWYDNVRDDLEMPGAREYFEGYMKKHFVDWDGYHQNVDKVWSGVLGYSSDLLPYVGQHPSKAGIYVLAGFTGHGMPRIPNCAKAIALLVRSRQIYGITTDLALEEFKRTIPSPYWFTEERLDSKKNLILGMMGQDGEVGGKDKVQKVAKMMESL